MFAILHTFAVRLAKAMTVPFQVWDIEMYEKFTEIHPFLIRWRAMNEALF
jgi:hypothetical protein